MSKADDQKRIAREARAAAKRAEQEAKAAKFTPQVEAEIDAAAASTTRNAQAKTRRISAITPYYAKQAEKPTFAPMNTTQQQNLVSPTNTVRPPLLTQAGKKNAIPYLAPIQARPSDAGNAIGPQRQSQFKAYDLERAPIAGTTVDSAQRAALSSNAGLTMGSKVSPASTGLIGPPAEGQSSYAAPTYGHENQPALSAPPSRQFEYKNRAQFKAGRTEVKGAPIRVVDIAKHYRGGYNSGSTENEDTFSRLKAQFDQGDITQSQFDAGRANLQLRGRAIRYSGAAMAPKAQKRMIGIWASKDPTAAAVGAGVDRGEPATHAFPDTESAQEQAAYTWTQMQLRQHRDQRQDTAKFDAVMDTMVRKNIPQETKKPAYAPNRLSPQYRGETPPPMILDRMGAQTPAKPARPSIQSDIQSAVAPWFRQAGLARARNINERGASYEAYSTMDLVDIAETFGERYGIERGEHRQAITAQAAKLAEKYDLPALVRMGAQHEAVGFEELRGTGGKVEDKVAEQFAEKARNRPVVNGRAPDGMPILGLPMGDEAARQHIAQQIITSTMVKGTMPELFKGEEREQAKQVQATTGKFVQRIEETRITPEQGVLERDRARPNESETDDGTSFGNASEGDDVGFEDRQTTQASPLRKRSKYDTDAEVRDSMAMLEASLQQAGQGLTPTGSLGLRMTPREDALHAERINRESGQDAVQSMGSLPLGSSTAAFRQMGLQSALSLDVIGAEQRDSIVGRVMGDVYEAPDWRSLQQTRAKQIKEITEYNTGRDRADQLRVPEALTARSARRMQRQIQSYTRDVKSRIEAAQNDGNVSDAEYEREYMADQNENVSTANQAIGIDHTLTEAYKNMGGYAPDPFTVMLRQTGMASDIPRSNKESELYKGRDGSQDGVGLSDIGQMLVDAREVTMFKPVVNTAKQRVLVKDISNRNLERPYEFGSTPSQILRQSDANADVFEQSYSETNEGKTTYDDLIFSRLKENTEQAQEFGPPSLENLRGAYGTDSNAIARTMFAAGTRAMEYDRDVESVREQSRTNPDDSATKQRLMEMEQYATLRGALTQAGAEAFEQRLDVKEARQLNPEYTTPTRDPKYGKAPKTWRDVDMGDLVPQSERWRRDAEQMARRQTQATDWEIMKQIPKSERKRQIEIFRAMKQDRGVEEGRKLFADYQQGMQVLSAVSRSSDLGSYKGVLDAMGKDLNIPIDMQNPTAVNDFIRGQANRAATIPGIGNPVSAAADRSKNTRAFLGRLGMTVNNGNVTDAEIDGDTAGALSDNKGMKDAHLTNVQSSIADLATRYQDMANTLTRKVDVQVPVVITTADNKRKTLMQSVSHVRKGLEQEEASLVKGLQRQADSLEYGAPSFEQVRAIPRQYGPPTLSQMQMSVAKQNKQDANQDLFTGFLRRIGSENNFNLNESDAGLAEKMAPVLGDSSSGFALKRLQRLQGIRQEIADLPSAESYQTVMTRRADTIDRQATEQADIFSGLKPQLGDIPDMDTTEGYEQVEAQIKASTKALENKDISREDKVYHDTRVEGFSALKQSYDLRQDSTELRGYIQNTFGTADAYRNRAAQARRVTAAFNDNDQMDQLAQFMQAGMGGIAERVRGIPIENGGDNGYGRTQIREQFKQQLEEGTADEALDRLTGLLDLHDEFRGMENPRLNEDNTTRLAGILGAKTDHIAGAFGASSASRYDTKRGDFLYGVNVNPDAAMNNEAINDAVRQAIGPGMNAASEKAPKQTADEFVRTFNKKATPEQKAVLNSPVDGLQLVNAGPGVGKTGVVAARAAQIAADGAGITVNTFSRSAAAEVRERLAPITGKEAERMRVNTTDAEALMIFSGNAMKNIRGNTVGTGGMVTNEDRSQAVPSIQFSESAGIKPLGGDSSDEDAQRKRYQALVGNALQRVGTTGRSAAMEMYSSVTKDGITTVDAKNFTKNMGAQIQGLVNQGMVGSEYLDSVSYINKSGKRVARLPEGATDDQKASAKAKMFLGETMHALHQEMADQGEYDFDFMKETSTRMLRNNKKVRDAYGAETAIGIVDEANDTKKLEARFAAARFGGGLMAVGDTGQNVGVGFRDTAVNFGKTLKGEWDKWTGRKIQSDLPITVSQRQGSASIAAVNAILGEKNQGNPGFGAEKAGTFSYKNYTWDKNLTTEVKGQVALFKEMVDAGTIDLTKHNVGFFTGTNDVRKNIRSQLTETFGDSIKLLEPDDKWVPGGVYVGTNHKVKGKTYDVGFGIGYGVGRQNLSERESDFMDPSEVQRILEQGDDPRNKGMLGKLQDMLLGNVAASRSNITILSGSGKISPILQPAINALKKLQGFVEKRDYSVEDLLGSRGSDQAADPAMIAQIEADKLLSAGQSGRTSSLTTNINKIIPADLELQQGTAPFVQEQARYKLMETPADLAALQAEDRDPLAMRKVAMTYAEYQKVASGDASALPRTFAIGGAKGQSGEFEAVIQDPNYKIDGKTIQNVHTGTVLNFGGKDDQKVFSERSDEIIKQTGFSAKELNNLWAQQHDQSAFNASQVPTAFNAQRDTMNGVEASGMYLNQFTVSQQGAPISDPTLQQQQATRKDYAAIPAMPEPRMTVARDQDEPKYKTQEIDGETYTLGIPRQIKKQNYTERDGIKVGNQFIVGGRTDDADNPWAKTLQGLINDPKVNQRQLRDEIGQLQIFNDREAYEKSLGEGNKGIDLQNEQWAQGSLTANQQKAVMENPALQSAFVAANTTDTIAAGQHGSVFNQIGTALGSGGRTSLYVPNETVGNTLSSIITEAGIDTGGDRSLLETHASMQKQSKNATLGSLVGVAQTQMETGTNNNGLVEPVLDDKKYILSTAGVSGYRRAGSKDPFDITEAAAANRGIRALIGQRQNEAADQGKQFEVRTGGESGFDMIAGQAAMDMGAPLSMMLPMAPEEFVESSKMKQGDQEKFGQLLEYAQKTGGVFSATDMKDRQEGELVGDIKQAREGRNAMLVANQGRLADEMVTYWNGNERSPAANALQQASALNVPITNLRQGGPTSAPAMPREALEKNLEAAVNSSRVTGGLTSQQAMADRRADERRYDPAAAAPPSLPAEMKQPEEASYTPPPELAQEMKRPRNALPTDRMRGRVRRGDVVNTTQDDPANDPTSQFIRKAANMVPDVEKLAPGGIHLVSQEVAAKQAKLMYGDKATGPLRGWSDPTTGSAYVTRQDDTVEGKATMAYTALHEIGHLAADQAMKTRKGQGLFDQVRASIFEPISDVLFGKASKEEKRAALQGQVGKMSSAYTTPNDITHEFLANTFAQGYGARDFSGDPSLMMQPNPKHRDVSVNEASARKGFSFFNQVGGRFASIWNDAWKQATNQPVPGIAGIGSPNKPAPFIARNAEDLVKHVEGLTPIEAKEQQALLSGRASIGPDDYDTYNADDIDPALYESYESFRKSAPATPPPPPAPAPSAPIPSMDQWNSPDPSVTKPGTRVGQGQYEPYGPPSRERLEQLEAAHAQRPSGPDVQRPIPQGVDGAVPFMTQAQVQAKKQGNALPQSQWSLYGIDADNPPPHEELVKLESQRQAKISAARNAIPEDAPADDMLGYQNQRVIGATPEPQRMVMADTHFQKMIEHANSRQEVTAFAGEAFVSDDDRHTVNVSSLGMRKQIGMQGLDRNRTDNTFMAYGMSQSDLQHPLAQDFSFGTPDDPNSGANQGIGFTYDPKNQKLDAAYGDQPLEWFVQQGDKQVPAHEALAQMQQQPIDGAATLHRQEANRGKAKGNEWAQIAEDLFNSSTKEQQDIINAAKPGSRTVVNADAGTGKTRTMMGVLGNLLKEGVLPEQMSMVTFTNKGIDEFKDKIRGTFGSKSSALLKKMNIKNSSVLANDIIRGADAGSVASIVKNSEFDNQNFDSLRSDTYMRAGRREELRGDNGWHPGDDVMMMHGVLAEFDKNKNKMTKTDRNAFRALQTEAEKQYRFGKFSHELPDVKMARKLVDDANKFAQNNVLGREAYADTINDPQSNPVEKMRAKFVMDYQTQQFSENKLGHEESNLVAMRALENPANQGFLGKMQQQFGHLFVDEGQDLSAIQTKTLEMLSGGQGVTVAGDEKQAIYGWRGAAGKIKNMFSGISKVLPLQQSWRSQQRVLDTINKIHGTGTNLPDARAESGKGGEVTASFTPQQKQSKEDIKKRGKRESWQTENDVMADSVIDDLLADPEYLKAAQDGVAGQAMIMLPNHARIQDMAKQLQPRLKKLGVNLRMKKSDEELRQLALTKADLSHEPEEGDTEDYKKFSGIYQQLKDEHESQQGIDLGTTYAFKGAEARKVYLGGATGEGSGQIIKTGVSRAMKHARSFAEGLKNITDPEERRDAEESENLLYVGMTRAKETLRLFGSGLRESRLTAGAARLLGLPTRRGEEAAAAVGAGSDVLPTTPPPPAPPVKPKAPALTPEQQKAQEEEIEKKRVEFMKNLPQATQASATPLGARLGTSVDTTPHPSALSANNPLNRLNKLDGSANPVDRLNHLQGTSQSVALPTADQTSATPLNTRLAGKQLSTLDTHEANLQTTLSSDRANSHRSQNQAVDVAPGQQQSNAPEVKAHITGISDQAASSLAKGMSGSQWDKLPADLKQILSTGTSDLAEVLKSMDANQIKSVAESVGSLGRNIEPGLQQQLAARLPDVIQAAHQQGVFNSAVGDLAKAGYDASNMSFRFQRNDRGDGPSGPRNGFGGAGSGGDDGGGRGGRAAIWDATRGALQQTEALARDAERAFDTNIKASTDYKYLTSRAAAATGRTESEVDAAARGAVLRTPGTSLTDAAKVQRYEKDAGETDQILRFSRVSGMDAEKATIEAGHIAKTYGGMTRAQVLNATTAIRNTGTTIDEEELLHGAGVASSYGVRVDSQGNRIGGVQRMADAMVLTNVLAEAGVDTDQGTRQLFQQMSTPDANLGHLMRKSQFALQRKENPNISERDLNMGFTNEAVWSWDRQQEGMLNDQRAAPFQMQVMRSQSGLSEQGFSQVAPTGIGAQPYKAAVMSAPLASLSDNEVNFRMQSDNLRFERENIGRQAKILDIQHTMQNRGLQQEALGIASSSLGLRQSQEQLVIKREEFGLQKQQNQLGLREDRLDLAQLRQRGSTAGEASQLQMTKAEIGFAATIRDLDLRKRQLPLQAKQMDLNIESQAKSIEWEREGIQFKRWYDDQMQGTIGSDRSYRAQLALDKSELNSNRNAGMGSTESSGVNKTQNEIKAVPVMGLQNEQFYAGITHQLAQMQYGRTAFRSEAAYSENVDYVQKQTDFYERRMAIEDKAREFSYRMQDEQLKIAEKQYEVQKELLALQKEALENEIADQTQLIPVEKRLAEINFENEKLDIQQQPERIAIKEAQLGLKEQGIGLSERSTELSIKQEEERIKIQGAQLALQKADLADKTAMLKLQQENDKASLRHQEEQLKFQEEMNRRQGNLLETQKKLEELAFERAKKEAELLDYIINSRDTEMNRGGGTDKGSTMQILDFALGIQQGVQDGTIDPRQIQQPSGNRENPAIAALFDAALKGELDDKRIEAFKVASKAMDMDAAQTYIDSIDSQIKDAGGYDANIVKNTKQEIAIDTGIAGRTGLDAMLAVERGKGQAGQTVAPITGPMGSVADIADIAQKLMLTLGAFNVLLGTSTKHLGEFAKGLLGGIGAATKGALAAPNAATLSPLAAVAAAVGGGIVGTAAAREMGVDIDKAANNVGNAWNSHWQSSPENRDKNYRDMAMSAPAALMGTFANVWNKYVDKGSTEDQQKAYQNTFDETMKGADDLLKTNDKLRALPGMIGQSMVNYFTQEGSGGSKEVHTGSGGRQSVKEQKITGFERDVLNPIQEMFANMGKEVGQQGKNATEWVAGVGKNVNEFFTGIGTSFETMKTDAGKEGTLLLKKMGDFFNGLGKWFDDQKASATKEGLSIAKNIGLFFGGIGKWFEDQKATITGKEVAAIGKKVGEFFTGIGKWFDDQKTAMAKDIKEIKKSVDGFFGGIGAWFAGIVKDLEKLTKNKSMANIGDLFNGLMKPFQDFVGSISDMFKKLADKLNPMLKALGLDQIVLPSTKSRSSAEDSRAPVRKAIGDLNVSQDMIAQLHQGEAVLTVPQAAAFRAGLEAASVPSIEMKQMVNQLSGATVFNQLAKTSEVQAPSVTMTAPQQAASSSTTINIDIQQHIEGDVSEETLKKVKEATLEVVIDAIKKAGNR